MSRKSPENVLKICLACAFGNEIAQTDDFVIVEATRTSALLLPKANRQVLVYFGDPIFFANRHSLGLFLGTQIWATCTSALSMCAC